VVAELLARERERLDRLVVQQLGEPAALALLRRQRVGGCAGASRALVRAAERPDYAPFIRSPYTAPGAGCTTL
jgi:hypothetical protein